MNKAELSTFYGSGADIPEAIVEKIKEKYGGEADLFSQIEKQFCSAVICLDYIMEHQELNAECESQKSDINNDKLPAEKSCCGSCRDISLNVLKRHFVKCPAETYH